MSVRRSRLIAGLAALALVAVACGGGDNDEAGDGSGAAAAGQLAGVLRVDSGACGDAGVASGSWFRMVQPGGSPADGPFVPNGDSPCPDKTWTPLRAGTAGGLAVGDFQPHPDPIFDEQGNGRATAILEPQRWFAVQFAVATNPVDPQTGTEVDPPVLRAGDDGTLTGDLRAFGVAWNGQHFNQGSPKPDGSQPGDTRAVSGTLDADSGRFVLDWTSQIVGGPFNNFTGMWHLEGSFEPA